MTVTWSLSTKSTHIRLGSGAGEFTGRGAASRYALELGRLTSQIQLGTMSIDDALAQEENLGRDAG